MTENEKAAMFIGWCVGQICRGCEARMTDHGFSGIDESGEPIGDTHPIDPPDMTKPENYMRSLEYVSLKTTYDIAFGHEAKGAYCDIADDNGNSQPRYSGYGKTWGEAVVAALAALYDAGGVP